MFLEARVLLNVSVGAFPFTPLNNRKNKNYQLETSESEKQKHRQYLKRHVFQTR